MRSSRLLLLLLSGGLVACSTAETEQAAPVVQEAPIATVADPSVVAVTSPNLPSWICSGSIVAARVVLTARHCVVGGNHDKTGWSFAIFIGADRNHSAPGDRVVKVKEFHYPMLSGDGASEDIVPTTGSDDADGDVAVLVLEEAVDLPRVAWNDAPLDGDLVGQNVRFIGYGRDKPNDDPTGKNGLRKVLATTVSAVTPGAVAIGAGPANPCHGDSGGPMLVDRNGIPTILGVGHEALSEDCVSGADYERVDRYAGFVQRWIDRSR